MNALAVGGLAAINFAAMFIIAKFLLMQLAIALHKHPAGEGLMALVA